MTEIKDQGLAFQVKLPVRYDEYHDPHGVNHTLILLHGYGESKERIQQTLGSHLQGCYRRLIVLNGPFPAPQLGREGYREGYAWYFQSTRAKKVMIPPEDCEPLFDRLIAQTLAGDLNPTTVIGYSQGGYIVPYLAQRIANLKRIIGIACGLHQKRWSFSTAPRFDLIHGENDMIVAAADTLAQLVQWPYPSAPIGFHKIAGGHEIDNAKIELLRGLLLE